MKKVLVVAGPTASGKSDFAVEVAKLTNGFIISGDSIQVYKGFDIGSGKVTEEEKQGVRHELIDILNYDEPYSVATFQKNARDLIDQATSLPVICGGTGLYLKACLYDYSFEEESEESLTNPELDSYTNEELYDMLQQMDPLQAEKIHVNNRRRLLRAITLIQRSGQPMSQKNAMQTHEPIYDVWIAGCTMDRAVLYDRINRRVEGMFANGLEKEVETFLQSGVSFRDQPMKGIGYQEWEPYFKKECTLQEVKENIQKHSRQFAKRQYTWFNHQMNVHWFNSMDQEDRQRMKDEIIAWMNQE